VRAQDDADTELSGGDGFAFETTSHSFARAVALIAQNELQPRFDQATFELARRRAAEELATALNGSSTIVNRRAASFLLPFADPELREPTVSGVQTLTLNDVKSYYAKTMRPDVTTIVIVGNVTVDAARAAVEKEFGGWHAAGPVPELELAPLPLNLAGEVKVPIPSGQDTVMFEQIVPLSRTAAQAYPLLLGNAILGGGSLGPEQSRLFRDLRQNAGLVYTISSQLSPRRSRFQLSIGFACLPSNEPRIAALIDEEIERMKTEPVGDFELSLAKASIVRQAAIADSSVSDIGRELLGNAVAGLPANQSQIDAEKFLATDAHAIQEAFAANIKPQNFVRIIEGP